MCQNQSYFQIMQPSCDLWIRGMLEAYLTSASSLDVKLKILIQTVMAEKRLIQQNKCDRRMQILKFLLKCYNMIGYEVVTWL
jgi:hypothetical protein